MDTLYHCTRGRHAQCPGERFDRGDGLLYQCECACHGTSYDDEQAQLYYHLSEGK